MPFATNASAPPEVKARHTGHCLTVWRTTWNDTFDRHGDEGRAFATAELAAQQCEASKMTDLMAVKFVDGSDSMIEGMALPYGGPAYLGGKDFDGESFGADTDFAFDWFPNEGRPFLWGHGLDPEIKSSVVGRQIERTTTDMGHWVKVQLDKRSRYLDVIQQLIANAGMSFSSGAIPHLVKTDDDGHIKVWPWVELSGTPTPSNPDAAVYAVKSVDAIEHLAAIRTDIPDAIKNSDSPAAPVAEPTYAEQTELVLAQVKAWADATTDRAEFRSKSGRELSKSNVEALREAHRILDDLIKRTERTPEAEAEAKALYAEFLRIESRILGVAV